MENKMNKSILIWGVVCLIIASGLAVANLTLPSNSMVFQIGNRNMPWIPPIVLAISGDHTARKLQSTRRCKND
jgi:hypothetical protein